MMKLKATKSNKAMMNNVYLRMRNTNDLYLDDVYGKYSNNKVRAYNYCMQLMNENDGYYPRIISHNIFTFSFAFLFCHENRLAVSYITKDYDRWMYLDEFYTAE